VFGLYFNKTLLNLCYFISIICDDCDLVNDAALIVFIMFVCMLHVCKNVFGTILCRCQFEQCCNDSTFVILHRLQVDNCKDQIQLKTRL